MTYSYAYDGSRLSKTVGKTSKSAGTTTEYILNGSTILAQNTTYANGETETLNFYYSSDGKLIEIGYLKYDGADGSSGLKDATENHYSVIRNAMGDVAALYTADGTLVGTYEYDPYGLPLATTENTAYTDADGILEKNPFRYRGYYYDSETGWYYLQSRYYDPEVKRFINADSVDLMTTDCTNIMQYNLFIYCNGNPINGYDPSGHFDIIEILDLLNGEDNVAAEGYGLYASASLGGLFSYSASFQFVFDSEDHIEFQWSIGDGVGGGAGADVGFMYNLYPSISDIEDIRNFGVNVGGSGGAEFGAGGDLIFAGEGDNLSPIGAGVHVGLAAGGEGHVLMTNTWGKRLR